MGKRGPNTAAGRAAVRGNALKHGLTSSAPVIPGESPEEWQSHLAEIMDSLQPGNYLQEQFARLIALGFWRRWRIERYEIEAVTNHMDSAEAALQIAQAYKEGTLSQGILPAIPREQIEAARRRRLLPPDLEADKIARYKASEHRQLLQNMHEYEALQARGKGEHTPLNRLDISGPPAP